MNLFIHASFVTYHRNARECNEDQKQTGNAAVHILGLLCQWGVCPHAVVAGRLGGGRGGTRVGGRFVGGSHGVR